MWSLKKVRPILELLAAVAVVSSLIFFGFRNQDLNLEAQNQANTQSIVTDFSATIQSLSESADLSCIYIRAAWDYLGLEDADRDRFDDFMRRLNRIAQSLYFMARAGEIEPHIWEPISDQIHEAMQFPGHQQWFASHRYLYTEGYQTFLSGWIEEPLTVERSSSDELGCETQ